MREALKAHAPSVGAFVGMLAIAAILATSIDVGSASAASGTGFPTDPIQLPGPGQDADRDSYADAVDVWDGDLSVRIEVLELRAPTVRAPYLLVGTQDDQWRTGQGRALEWRHVVDHDPLGRAAGSPSWTQDVLRTGTWIYSVPMEGSKKAIAATADLRPDAVPVGVEWPQVFHVNVRDDARRVNVTIELYDAERDPDALVRTWHLEADAIDRTWRIDGGPWSPSGTEGEAAGVRIQTALVSAPGRNVQEEVASRWAPAVRFGSGERFFPTSGDTLSRFHYFSHRGPETSDYRTWTKDFNNGRDSYVLLLADFNGDRRVDHGDAALMYEILRAGTAQDTVYAHVANATGDRVVVQYWFVYMYNFVRGETGEGIQLLAHSGDREFIQLTFASLEEARQGMPESVAYSQHYKGIRIPDPRMGLPPFASNSTNIDVFSATGSHASYPVAGDDRRFRPAFSNWGDTFDGLSETWTPDNYTLEILGDQDWHQGHLWGPITRHGRDLGTATKPLLQHTFRYPFQDPIAWESTLRPLEAAAVQDTYGRTP